MPVRIVLFLVLVIKFLVVAVYWYGRYVTEYSSRRLWWRRKCQ